MRTTWNFFSAGQLTFGRGAIKQLPVILQRHGWRRPLLVTDRQLIAVGICEKVTSLLHSAEITPRLFDEGEAEPAVATAERAVALAREFKPDVILGLGGGSNMDLAKIIAAAYAHGGAASAYFGFDNIPGPVTPLVCLPTTAGTGSEVSHAAVLTDTANHIKVSTLSNYLRPAIALVDPELTDTCPKKVTADSGIDALTHAIEAYTAVDCSALNPSPSGQQAYEGRFPLGECLAEKAIALVAQHLIAAVNNGSDTVARDGMALAATTAGLAFSNCAVALVHALEYPLGGVLHCSHGAGNGLLLPYVMRFNLPYRVAEFARIASLLGENTAGLTEQAAAEKAIAAVERLNAAIGIPLRIRDLGGKREQLPSFAEKAFAIKRLMTMNPRPIQSAAELLEILEEAF
jgi:alcohol dehydrogenase class IV